MLLSLPVTSHAVSVQPLVIDLQTRGRATSQIIRVENTYKTPLPVEIRIFEADYTDEGLLPTSRPSGELLVFPPQALIAPGKTQAFRVQYVGDSVVDRSRHFVVTIAQLPVQLPQSGSKVQILYNFNIVVGVAAPSAKAALRIERSEIEVGADAKARPIFYVRNDAETYGYLANGSLSIKQRDASGREIFSRDLTDQQVNQEIGLGLVGPGQTRRLVVPIPLPQTGGTVDARYNPNRR